MEENPVNKHIKLEGSDDAPASSILLGILSENQFVLDASLGGNVEMCSIEKQDPELFDAGEFLTTGVAVDNQANRFEEDNDINANDDVYYNYDECISNNEEVKSYPIKLEKGKYVDIDVIDSLENQAKKINLKTKSSEQKEKMKKHRERHRIFKPYFILLCPHCGIEMKNYMYWKDHMNSAHNFDKNLQQYYTFIDESHRQCNECRVVIKAKLNQLFALRAHTILHLPHNEVFKCKICSEHHACEAGIRWHIETEHIEVIGSILLAHGFDVDHHENSNSDTDSDDPDNIKKTESNEIAEMTQDQQTQNDNRLTKQKTKLQICKNILKKYMIRLCPVCGKECGQLKKNWWNHIISVHNITNNREKSYTYIKKLGMQCNECKLVLRLNKQDLLRHNITHLPYKQIYKCKICAELRTWTRGLRCHIEKEHNDIVRRELPSLIESTEGKYCVYCEKNIGHNVKFLEHMQKEHSEVCKNKILLICPECGIKFSRERLYRLHINSVHKFDTLQGLSFEEIVGDVDDETHRRENKMKYRCIKCDLLFASCKMTILKTHAITHLPHQNYKCRYCDYSDSSKRKLLMHGCKELLDAFKSVPEIVYKRIRKKRYQPLNRKAIDRTDKLYVCPRCGEEFNTVMLHEQHLKLAHEFENVISLNINMIKEDTQCGDTSLKYICNVCNRGFKLPNISNFKLHAFKHMPFKLYKCALCHTASTKLITCPCKDSDTMNGIIFICPKCEVKQFNNEKEWFAHIQECHAEFVTPNNLNFEQTPNEDAEHLTYKCNSCGKIIKQLQLSGMLVHALEHMSKKCFKCKMCERSYDCKGDALLNVYKCIQIKLSSDKWHDEETTFTKNWRTCSKFAKCQCPVCGFLDEDNKDVELVGHLKQAHSLELQSAEHMNFMQCTDCTSTDKGQRSYKCLECNQMFPDCSLTQLQEHKLTHLPYRMWHCGFCAWEFNTKAKVLDHIINWHIEQERMRERDSTYLLSFACPVCNEKFNLNTEWRTHMNSKHAFNTLIGLRLVQERNSFKCIDCKRRVRKDKKFTHRFRHLPHKPYKCRFCPHRFKTLNPAREHATACREKKGGDKKLKNNNKAINCNDSNSGDIENIEQAEEAGKIEKQNRNKYIGYACPECNIPLSTEELWYVHINEQHSSFGKNLNIKEAPGAKPIGICLECNKQISGYSLSRELHKMQHMPYRAFICKICRYRAKSKNLLRKHFTHKHFALVELICDICSHVCNTHYDFSTHMKTQHTNIASWPANLCPICIDSLPDGTNVDLHIKTTHLTEDIEEYEKETEGRLLLKSKSDEQTGLVIKNDSGAAPVYDIPTEMILPDTIPSDSHEIANIAAQAITSMATCSSKSTTLNKFYPYMTYACPECNLSLPTQKEWHSHITTKHDFFAEHSLNIKDTPGGASQSICLECGSKIFGSVLHKHRHKLTHMPYRSFICTICLHRSKNQNGLFDHMKRKHFTPGEYKCEMCRLVFKTACERYTHAKSEHMDIEWPKNVCPICVATLGQWSISEHIKTHGNDREQFLCGYCIKFYLSKSERIKHVREEHPLEHEKEQLEKESENGTDRTSKDGKKTKKDIKIKAENDEEFVGNINKIKLKSLKNFLPEEIPTTSKGKRGRPKKTKTTESITICSASGLNKSIVLAKRKRGRPKKIETIKFEDDSSEDSDYTPNLNEFVKKGRPKKGRPKKIETIKFEDDSNEDSDYTPNLNEFVKKGRPKKIETIKFEDDSNEDSDYTPNLNEFVSSSKEKLPQRSLSSEIIYPDTIQSGSHEITNVAAQAITSMATCSSRSTALNKFYPYMTYACPECNLSLPTQKEWHSHITTKHDFFAEHSLNIKDTPGGASQSICLECGSKIFGSVLHKHRHKLTHMPYRSFICTICLHRSKNQNGLFDHMKRKHFTPGEYKCEMCTIVFKTACERYTHAKTEHKDIEWPINVCPICVSTLSQSSISEHIKTHEYDREQFLCGYCNKYYLSKFERIRHVREEHCSEYEKEQLEKKPESRIDSESKDCKEPKSDIKVKAENDEELVGNINKIKRFKKFLPEEIPTTSKEKRGRPKKIKTTESITECCTSALNNFMVLAKGKRDKHKNIETIKFEAYSNEDSDYTPNLNEFVSSSKDKLPRKRVKSKKRKLAWSDTESE